MDFNLILVSVGLLFLAAIYGSALWLMSAMTGSNDDWNNVKNKISLISALLIWGGSMFALAVTLACAFYVGPLYTAYGSVFMAIYASSLAIGAMAVAAMMKATCA
jgi:hypothetical protein